ncbi:hypothetical protein ACFW0V_04785 [Micromonospora parva]|uniref:hypothetical protein n=1 Tax=Micromonospora parva TaxID=1464048 RepID=UPI003672C3C1
MSVPRDGRSILIAGAPFLLEGPTFLVKHDLAEGLGDVAYDADGHRGHHPLIDSGC